MTVSFVWLVITITIISKERPASLVLAQKYLNESSRYLCAPLVDKVMTEWRVYVCVCETNIVLVSPLHPQLKMKKKLISNQIKVN